VTIGLDHQDLAKMREWYRQGQVIPTSELLDRAGRSPRTDVLVSMLLPRAIARDGHTQAAAEIARRFQRDLAPGAAACLLDLAAAHRLPCLSGSQALASFGDAVERRLRHAAWRFASGCGPDRQIDAGLARLARASGLWSLADQVTWLTVARQRGLPERDIRVAVPDPPAVGFSAPHTLAGAAGEGLTIVQTSLRGALFRPGEGDSGGLGVFLTTLGTALAGEPGIRRVITVALAGEDGIAAIDQWFTEISPGHFVLTVPDFGEEDGCETAGSTVPGDVAYRELGWWLQQLLRSHHACPDVVHVRFSDDATWAAATTASQLGARLAFTVTPDPHRTYFARRAASGAQQDETAEHEDLHRMFLADLLLDADVVFGLPGRGGVSELAAYFPVLRPGPGSKHVRMVSEGIAAFEAVPDDDRVAGELIEKLHQAATDGLPRLDRSRVGVPLIVNVGRLHTVKQQDMLLDAWLSSELGKRTVLVLIGGSSAQPTSAESAMLARLRGMLSQATWATGRVAILPSLPNRHVRLLESYLPQLLPADLPHIYACSSFKEEFGIAILEAMDAGLLAIGPRRGGPANYIRNGQNGFLVDSSSSQSLAAGIESALSPWDRARGCALREIARAGQETVRNSYDIRGIVHEFADVYAEVAVTGSRRQMGDGAGRHSAPQMGEGRGPSR
jgi:D-inositol-3-phosphate glycosyltransferase